MIAIAEKTEFDKNIIYTFLKHKQNRITLVLTIR